VSADRPTFQPTRRLPAGAMALALGMVVLVSAPLFAAAAASVPIGAAAPLPPDIAAPQPLAPPPGPPQNPGDPELQALLYDADVPVIAGERLRHPGLVRQFYAEHGNEPFWSSHPRQATALIGAVLRAEDQGLDPRLFHAGALFGRGIPLSAVARDVLTTDAILSYADALAEGAVPRRQRPPNEALHPVPIDVVAAVDRAIAAPDPARVITALAPSSPEYQAMRRAYLRYRALAAGAERAPDMSGARYDRYGDALYPPYYARYRREEGYGPVDPWLAQRRARQLAVALERLRWLPRHMPPDRIIVNVATQRLHLFEDDRPVFTTKVVVGEPTWQTPEFHATIDDVLFNPPWNIPPDILRKEILPKLARDPGYLARHHMRWIGPQLVQQQAGPYSALGRLKFEMSDPYEVYLHDTPEKYLFRLANRMKSHGCVRVEYPQELAALILHESPYAIARNIAERRTHAQALPQPLDVYIVYQTVSLSPSGALEFHADPYHRDDEIWQLLNPAEALSADRDNGLYAQRVMQ
jgi:murein L,D-transpeptidase YcbB/YkuD